MPQLFTNNASALLSAAVSPGDTVINVTSGLGDLFPSPSSPDFAILTLTQPGSGEVSWEEVMLTSRSGDYLTIVRAQEGSTALTWAIGDKVELRVTAGMLNNVGYRNVPQQIASANYTCNISDQGKHILHPSSDTTARIFTIPSNASVPYQIGTALTFINQNGAGVLTISVTTDTMRQATTGSVGSRMLVANGVATAIKITATEWLISGAGLS